MVEKMTERGFSTIELMRAVSSNFDDNMLVPISDLELISNGMPLVAWGEKAKLLNSIKLAFVSNYTTSSDMLEQENMQLRNENSILRDALLRIEERLASIEASLPSEKVIVLREITKEEATAEIRRLFSNGKTLYYSDIARELGLDLELVVEICNELQNHGEITVDA